MKKLSLRPYHGTIWLCETRAELMKRHKYLTRSPWPYGDGDAKGGQFVLLEHDALVDRVFLVHAHTPAALAHELSHVLLIVFDTIGHDPRKGDGEPFCYMLSQLMLDAGVK